MTPKEMESVRRSMTDSFMDYEMTGTNLGMLEHLDREHFYYVTRRMYEHFGMKMVREHIVSKRATYYEMFKGEEGIA